MWWVGGSSLHSQGITFYLMTPFLRFWKPQDCVLLTCLSPKHFLSVQSPGNCFSTKAGKAPPVTLSLPPPPRAALWWKSELNWSSLLQILPSRVGITYQMYKYSREKSHYKTVLRTHMHSRMRTRTHTYTSFHGHCCPEFCFPAILEVISLMPFNTGTASWILV